MLIKVISGREKTFGRKQHGNPNTRWWPSLEDLDLQTLFVTDSNCTSLESTVSFCLCLCKSRWYSQTVFWVCNTTNGNNIHSEIESGYKMVHNMFKNIEGLLRHQVRNCVVLWPHDTWRAEQLPRGRQLIDRESGAVRAIVSVYSCK